MKPIEVQAVIDWDYVRDEYSMGVVGTLNGQDVEWIDGSACCDHETCYETHEALFVFRYGDRFFCRRAEYSSFSGTVWVTDLYEVRRTEMAVNVWTAEPQ